MQENILFHNVIPALNAVSTASMNLWRFLQVKVESTQPYRAQGGN